MRVININIITLSLYCSSNSLEMQGLSGHTPCTTRLVTAKQKKLRAKSRKKKARNLLLTELSTS